MRKLSETDFYTKPQESSINSHLAQIQHYQRLLQQLESAKPVTPAAFVADIKASPSHFLGIPASQTMISIIMRLKELQQTNAEYFNKLVDAWRTGKITLLIDFMSEINAMRLYWVWGGSLLDTIFSLANKLGKIDDNYFAQLEKKLNVPAPIMGNMSWILYYARFFIRVGLILQHTLPDREYFVNKLNQWRGVKVTASPEYSLLLPMDPEIDLIWLHENRDKLAMNLLLHQQQIDAINPALFPYLSKQRKKALQENLQMAIWLNYLQYYSEIKEKELPWYKRLQAQWSEHKYQLINDSIWATANLACYFWLTYRASPRLGMYGDFLTALLLVMDTTLTVIRFMEEQQKHDALMKELKTELGKLDREIAGLKDPAMIASRQEHRKLLVERMERCAFDWHYQKLGLYNDLFYATSLLLAFCVLIGLFVPGGQVFVPAVILIGAVACFALTVLYNAVNNLLPVLKSKSEIKQLNQKYQTLLSEFNQCDDEQRQKELFIQLQDIEQQVLALQKKISFQIIMGIRDLIIDSLTPAVVLVAIMFMPVGAGVGMLGGAFVLAVASKYTVQLFKPKEAEPTVYSEEKFRLFKQEKKPSNTAKSSKNEKTYPHEPEDNASGVADGLGK